MSTSFHTRRLITSLLALGIMLSLIILTTLNAQANTVTINDASHVLDAGKVRSEAAQFPDPLLVYTTNTFTGNQESFNQQTRQYINNAQEVVIGIDTAQHHLSVESGTSAKLSDSQASDAVTAFKDSFNGGDYTGATISAIDSVQSSLGGGSPNRITPAGIVVAVLLGIGAVILVVILFIRRRTTRGGGPPSGGGGRRWGWNNGYYGAGYYAGSQEYSGTHSSSGSHGGGAGGSFGGGGFGGGAGGGFGGGSGGAGGSF